MAKWRPTVSRQQLFPDNPNALNSEYYGQRMGMIMDSGAGRFFEQDPTSLVNLAASSLSNDDMLETLFMANDQISLNTLRQQFENLPPMTKKAEFNRLPPKTQNLLLASGLKSPKEEEDQGLFERIFTWDNPLLPEEFLRDKGVIADSFAGTAFKGLLAPVSAVGFVLGKAASTLWEYGAEKPNRFAKRLGRSLAHMDETNDPFVFAKPPKWRRAWNETKIEENSFTDESVEKAVELIGTKRTMMLRAYLTGGVAEVEQRLIDRGEAEGWSEERVSEEFYRWQRESDDAAHVKAKEILESHRLDGFNYSIRAYNKSNLGLIPDVTPDSWQGKTVGFTGAMATEILLDPLMYAGGIFTKIFRRAKAGIRGGGSYEQIHFWQRMTEIENAATYLRTANGRITPEYTRAFKEGLNEYAGEVAEWTASNSGLATLNATNLNIRIQARAQNRMINRINEAFDALNALDDEMITIRNQRAADGLEPLNRWELEQAAIQNTGKTDLLHQLSRDFPGIDPVIDDMRNWHAYQRDKIFLHTDDADVFKVSDSLSSVLKEGDEILGANGERIVVDAAMLEKMDRRLFMRAPDLSTREGYWAFLQDAPGRKALTTSFGGTDPGAMWLPRIGAAGARWVEGKRYMRKILDFGAKTPEVDEDMARLAANYIAGQTDYVAARVAEDIANRVITLSRVVDEDALARIINQGDSQIQSSLAEQLGLTVDDMTKIQKSVDEAMKDAPNIILEDGYLDPLLRWYQDQGFVEVKGKLRPARIPINVPLSGAARAARNHFYDQLHAVGSLNGEVSWATRVGMHGKSAFTFLAYHPARWAEKLTTYTPKQTYIDVLGKDAISDFKALIDMGVMSNVPRIQLDNYLRIFITGNEAQRWWVQTQFTLDFLGRSGALTQGGRDVQDFIKRFIQHGNAHYSALQNDFVGVYEGLGLKRAILGSAAHDAQLSRMNVIPNYRELAAVSKYMAFYRMAGWGIHLPYIDKFLARTWRPAVLLRLGYVARNGGEELFSWWLREGPKHWAHQKAARKAQGSVIVWDEYGRKVVRAAEDLGEEAYEAMLWKPVSRLWRSFNEVAGIGDFAITAKAIKKAAEEQGPRWAFLSADERMRVFEKARSEELRRVELNPFSRVGRGAFELGNAMARSYAKRMSEFGEWLGMPTRRELARHFLERTDPDHELRIFLSGYALTNPTILDEQMKNILGTFDTYTNFEKNAMSSAMRREGLGSTVPELLKLPIDYTRTAMKWVTNAGADANQGTKAIAMAQYLSKLPDDIGSRAMLAELAHYVSEVQDASLKPVADRLIASLSPAEQVRFRGTVGRAARTEPFDPGLLKFETSIALSELEEVAEPVVVMITGSRFVPKNRAPLPKAEIDRIKQAIRDSLNALPDGSTVRVGGAAGVDQYAEKIVLDMQKAGRDIKLERYYVPKTGPESWSRGGRAGPIRNRRMLEGRPHDAPDTPPRGNADVLFAFHPGKGMGPQTPTVSVSGLTGRGAKALTYGLGHQAHNKYFSTKLVVPFAEWARLSPGGVQNPGAIIEVTSVRGDRIRLRVKAREIITDKNNFHEVNPLDMHLSKNPQKVLQSMVAQKAAKGSRQLDEPIRIKRGKNLDIEQTAEFLTPQEANRLISFDVEVIKPDALTAADRATRASGKRVGSGTEDAMQAAFSAGVRVDDGARLGRPETISKGAQRASHYRRLRIGALNEGHFVDESVEGGQTVMRVYKAGTQTDERFIPAVEAVPALSASATVITLLREADPKVLRRLREAFDTSASQNTRLAVVWEDALDEVLDFLPREQREIWLDLFRPRYSGPVDPVDAALPGRLLRSAEAGPVGEPFGLTQPTLDVYGRSFSTVDDLPSGYKNELTVKSDPETGEALYTNAFVRLDDAGQPVIYMNLAQMEKHYPKYGTDRPFERYKLWEAGLGIDSAFVRENLEPGGLIRITAQDLTNPDEFLRIANEHLGEGVLALDSPLEGYLGHAALTWEHEMMHVRLGHPYARKHLGDDFDSSKEAWRARELDVDSEVFRRLGIDERQLNPDPSRVRLRSVPAEAVARAADDVPAAAAGAINVRGSDDVLSNFHNAPLEFRGHTFQTAEGAYQAFKSVDGDYKPGFENLTGAAAKQRGKKIETDKSITEDLMREILAARHAQQPEFREALRATGSSQITHHVPGRPDFWNTQGKDTFARLLTELRDSSAVVPEPVRRGIDVNLAGFLLSDANPTRLTDDFDEIARRLQDAYVTALSTPEGQQQAHSMARSVLGGDPSSPTISHPLPESHLRIFMPFIPIALLDDLNEVITGLRAVSPESAMFKQEFERILQAKAEVLGITEPLGEKVGRLLNPASAPGVGIGDNAYTQMALHWRDSGEQFMPLVVGSADDRIATIISEALLEAVARRRGVSVESLGAARIASRDIHADEFFNDFGRAVRERAANTSQPTVSHRRAGLEVEIDGARRANQPETFGTTYYGMTENGVEPASAFGAGGLKNEQVFGVVPEKLVPTVDGARGVEMVNGKPLTRRLSVYKHKRGERPSTVVRTGDHRKAEWYGDGSDWELASEHVTTGNDLRNFVEGQAIANSLELVHHMSNVSRGGSPEVFFPWIREALGGDIDAGRIQELTDLSGWWSKAPSNILAFVPVSDDAGNAINKGWNSLLRNWFDGVVNPMIGAMVREPLFHHYLLEGWKQTADVKMLYRHAPGRYDNLKTAFGRQAVFEEGQQLVITPFESFIKFDWSMAAADPKDVFSRVAFALDDNNPKRLVSALDDVLKIDDLGRPVHDLSKTQREFFGTLRELAETGGDDIQDFFGWAKSRKIGFETHRDHALQRAMTLSSAYIDDHRIRSQFQQMVGTAMPFWFAEDQFLRRMGRSIKHNPMMLRRLNLTMSAGVHGGLIQEDQHGSKVLVYPGSEIATTAILEFTDRFPIINRFFGGPLGSVVKSNLTTNINVIPGYNLEQVGQMGFGPLLAVPINYIGNRDPMLRKSYERNMVGGRYTPDQTGQILLQSVLPAVIARPVMFALGELGFEPSAIVKAQQDIIRLRALNGQLPTQEEIAAQPNPELFMEQFMDEVAEQARQYLLLQSMSWWLGPATAKLSQLTTDPAWEWNKEFYDILDAGVPWEEAYENWQNRIIAEEGSFDPFKYSPFRVSPTSKSTFAVLEATQEANVWLTHNKGFITNYPHTSAFFMPRGFKSDDDEYSSEARARQHAYGLRYYDTPREYLENLYYQNAMPTYMRARKAYQSKRYYSRSLGLSTDQMDREWDVTEQMFFTSNPIFTKRFQSGESRELRTKTVDELELLVADPSQIPDGPHKEDLILAANHILLLDRTMRDLRGLRSVDAQNSRESARMSAYEGMRRLVVGKPWLNEIYYSVFLPILGDTWIARYEAGLIGV